MMMPRFLIGVFVVIGAVAVFLAAAFFVSPRKIVFRRDTNSPDTHANSREYRAAAISSFSSAPAGKSPKERLRDAYERSARVKALYMTANIANDPSKGAEGIRRHIIKLAETTEISGVVIDVKEVCGVDYRAKRLKPLVEELRAKGIWTIARIAAFKDGSQIYAHPEWYIKRKEGVAGRKDECERKGHLRQKSLARHTEEGSGFSFWQDRRGGYWLDPASHEVWNYILDVSKDAVDLGFDELQYDYIRFPSDGDVEYALYPVWDRAVPMPTVLRGLFAFLKKELKTYKPDIILSADIFGDVALKGEELSIGQRLEDFWGNFDYLSPMVYPSHYYRGFSSAADHARGYDAVFFTRDEARAHPDVVVERSLISARDYFSPFSNADALFGFPLDKASSPHPPFSPPPAPFLGLRIRPWLEDFYHREDRFASRPYGVKKMRLQIDAAERVVPYGWMLWNAANVYTEEALREKERGGMR